MQKMNVEVVGTIIPAGAGRCYVEFDRIRLIVEDGVVTGWYMPEVVNAD